MKRQTYQWKILQEGGLALRPDGTCLPSTEHACTTTLVWPSGETPNPQNSVIIDPCFTSRGWRQAQRQLSASSLSIGDIGYFFITHDHFDHQVTLPCEVGPLPWKGLDPDGTESLPDIRMVHLPGHDTALRGLSFCTASDEVWVVGDAILDSDWLKLWGYYWPNGYGADDIIRTWRSVALILSSANTVIPGHGPPIHVSSELLEALIAGFPQAAQAAKCLDVESALRTRLSEGS